MRDGAPAKRMTRGIGVDAGTGIFVYGNWGVRDEGIYKASMQLRLIVSCSCTSNSAVARRAGYLSTPIAVIRDPCHAPGSTSMMS